LFCVYFRREKAKSYRKHVITGGTRNECRARDTMNMQHLVHISRDLKPGQYRLVEVFADILTCDVLHAIFDDTAEIDRIVECTKVHVVDRPNEMYVDDDDGSITIGLAHLRLASDEFLYLDIIHELCHVKQHLQGRELYDPRKAYVDRETEIEAYQLTVREARRIGLNEDAICNYLSVAWITPEEHKRLICRLGVAGSTREVEPS
jgi:hypothetical protein